MFISYRICAGFRKNWEVVEQINCPEPVCMVFWLEQFLGQGDLTILSEIGRGYVTAKMIWDRLLKPQRFGVVDGGFGANEIAGLVVLFDGVASEPVFDAGVIVIQPPESLGCGSAMNPTIENLCNGLGQSESMKLIQESFKETGAKTC